MKYKAVITGEIDNSYKTIQYRKSVLQTIEDTFHDLKDWGVAFENYQGYGFQALLECPETAARVALILRCAVKALSPKDETLKLDIRQSIGIGTLEYYCESIGTSDGQVFRLSGIGLDAMKKNRLSIHTPWEEFNQPIRVSTAFLDSLMTSWSAAQSQLILKLLSSEANNKQLAELLGESQQNISKKLQRVQANNVKRYLHFFEKSVSLLTCHTSE